MNYVEKKQGLYNPRYEHDSCGVGFVANIKGKKSHKIILDALNVLNNLTHRGASGADPNTGDGAGILIQIHHKFFKKVTSEININIGNKNQYGVGMFFFPKDENSKAEIKNIIHNVVEEEGQIFLGWRGVPTDSRFIGKTAKSKEPDIFQCFIRRSSKLKSEIDFERRLYLIRRRIEKAVKSSEIYKKEDFYIPSFSHRTIVYKGMLMAEQVPNYYPDLKDNDMSSSVAVIHSRFSTNTFPNWERAHPYRLMIHNGEINTLRGNVNWMHARQSTFEDEDFGDRVEKVLPVIDETGSDSAMFDNCLEFLVMSGYSLPYALMLMIPEPWEKHKQMNADKKAFYKFHSCMMEPWDGPASVITTDGRKICAVLDRNGLRPSRYYVTDDDHIIMASEVGVLDIDPKKVLIKNRLQPGRMLMVDMDEGRIISDDELKSKYSNEKPYQRWLDENLIPIEKIDGPKNIGVDINHRDILIHQKAFGYTYEDLHILMKNMAEKGIEALGSMGNDTPLSVLSDKPTPLYTYFKQLFAQVTNPPIDAIREELITSTLTTIGRKKSILNPGPDTCNQILINSPILTNSEFQKICKANNNKFRSITIPIFFSQKDGKHNLEKKLDDLFKKAEDEIKKGANILILSDRSFNKDKIPIPALLAVSGLHHYLIRKELRTHVSIILESGEPREVHHFCVLLGYGATAINPYLAYESLCDLIDEGHIEKISKKKAIENYIKAANKGIVKVLSKMGISTIQSYRGAQIFEAVGLNSKLIDKYFTWTSSRLEGIGLDEIAKEAIFHHNKAYEKIELDLDSLDSGGNYKWRHDGEYHLFNPHSIYLLQKACRNNSQNLYNQYRARINIQTMKYGTLRGLFEFKFGKNSIPIDEVESEEEIMRRFKTGAMSYGSISKEAHETLAIAMNRIGGKSNTGEGGEDPKRFIPDSNGDLRKSAIKQVASGRFGVTSHYLVNSDEIQIKMAQGAKPGEGGQLPGTKVYPWIAKVRHSTPGVGLISPPPHHDIYSIEDLAELIHDLKNANNKARINVKLVSEVGVGTIAAGVAKGHADVVLISGYDGGTGASPQTSIKHAGLPWELGLADTHQTLVMNNLRSRIVVETDGQMKTGRDVVVAALLGAEEFGFASAPLVVMGCVMMRVCQKNTCPVGIATQDPKLRKRFRGSSDHVVNYFRFIAEEVRELMAKLGFRTFNEMIGRVDKLNVSRAVDHWKAKGLDLSPILYRPKVDEKLRTYCQTKQDHGLDKSLDRRKLLEICKPAIEEGKQVRASIKIRNVNRVVGTMVGSEISRRYGSEGLPDDTIDIRFEGSAGQSFAAFVPRGLTFTLEGDANDYFGKGLSGGKLIVYPPRESTFIPEENIIVGNVAFYGATSGEAYISGVAGERFCVRNSGIYAVVEGVGDHGCEYMTGGRVVVLGETGRNFAAGMSGGIAYVLDQNRNFSKKCNQDMVTLETFNHEEALEVKQMIQNHVKYTNSKLGKKILKNWNKLRHKFVKVMPNDYKRMLEYIEKVKEKTTTKDEVLLSAFELNAKNMARAGDK